MSKENRIDKNGGNGRNKLKRNVKVRVIDGSSNVFTEVRHVPDLKRNLISLWNVRSRRLLIKRRRWRFKNHQGDC